MTSYNVGRPRREPVPGVDKPEACHGPRPAGASGGSAFAGDSDQKTLPGLFTDDSEVTDKSTADFLENWLKAFHAHIAKSLAPVS
ncbi:MAG: hypothetical protein ACK5LN_13555 [Propioniciclava sp.]